MNKTNLIDSVNSHDIINLMGLDSLSDEEKNSLRLEIEEEILSNFFAQRLDKILTKTDLDIINQKIQDKQDLKKILDFIVDKAPNVGSLLLEYTVYAKRDLLMNHYGSMIESFQGDAISDENKDKLDKYMKAKILIEHGDYKELELLFKL